MSIPNGIKEMQTAIKKLPIHQQYNPASLFHAVRNIGLKKSGTRTWLYSIFTINNRDKMTDAVYDIFKNIMGQVADLKLRTKFLIDLFLIGRNSIKINKEIGTHKSTDYTQGKCYR